MIVFDDRSHFVLAAGNQTEKHYQNRNGVKETHDKGHWVCDIELLSFLEFIFLIIFRIYSFYNTNLLFYNSLK